MEVSYCPLNILKVVMNRSSVNERTLSRGDRAVHVWLKPVGNNFTHELAHTVYYTNGLVVTDLLRPFFLW
jgi:hypothetical protein